jgi:hypothetical protein
MIEFSRMPDDFTGGCGRKACRICWESHVVTQALESADFGRIAEVLEQVLDAYCQEADDRCYYKSILDGSWPSAVEQLERALVKAKARAA